MWFLVYNKKVYLYYRKDDAIMDAFVLGVKAMECSEDDHYCRAHHCDFYDCDDLHGEENMAHLDPACGIFTTPLEFP